MEVRAADDENLFHACASQILKGSTLFDKVGIAGGIQPMKHFFIHSKGIKSDQLQELITRTSLNPLFKQHL